MERFVHYISKLCIAKQSRNFEIDDFSLCNAYKSRQRIWYSNQIIGCRTEESWFVFQQRKEILLLTKASSISQAHPATGPRESNNLSLSNIQVRNVFTIIPLPQTHTENVTGFVSTVFISGNPFALKYDIQVTREGSFTSFALHS